MRRLRLSVVSEWRPEGKTLEDTENWRAIRQRVLERDSHTCFYCGFSSPSWMEVHHMRGRFDDQSPENLSTLCPFCHSCHHIGFTGIQRRGRLLFLKKSTSVRQEELNYFLLDSISRVHSFKVFSEMEGKLPVEENYGAEGLVSLANLILSKQRKGEPDDPPERLLFLPIPEKYEICKFLLRRGA